MGIFKSNILNQKGQALLIVVLVMVVALTVTLSLVSRSIVDLKTSTDQANSQKALAAAEAGVEQAINNSIGIGSNRSLDNISYKAEITSISGTAPFLVNGGNLIAKNEGAYIWLSEYDRNNPWSHPSWNGDLTIYWGEDSDGCKNAALEIDVLYLTDSADLNSVKITKYAYDPCSSRTISNHFTSVSASAPTTISNKTFLYKKSINISNGLLVSVNPIYFSSYIGVSGSIALPDQGSIISSTGNSGGSNNVSRKVTVYQGYPQLPFMYSILQP